MCKLHIIADIGNACGGGGGGDDDPTCQNQNSNCDYWAEQGYCQHSYVDYMTTNCKKSCEKC